jgi:membrane fusion protein (multidrug efflux system)
MRLGLAIKRFWLVPALTLAAVSADAQPMPGGPPAVGVVRVAKQQITQSNEFVGRIQSIGRVSLVARVSAFLEKREFVEGEEVKKGDLLYLLEQPPFQAQVDFNKANVAQFEAQHTFAAQQLARAGYLLRTPAGQQQQVDQDVSNERSLAAQIVSAKAQLETAQINLDYTEIRAPIDGKISATAVTEGNVVSPTSGTLATLVSQDPMYVNFPVALRTALELRDRYVPKGGFPAVVIRLRLPNNKIYGQVGHLDYVAPTIDQTTDTIMLRGVIPNPVLVAAAPGQPTVRELSDGEFITALLEGVQPVEVLAVPRPAVLSDQQGDYVYVVDGQNKAQIRRIHLGQSTPSTAVVTSGLSEGELVISEGLQRARPGAVVSPGPASPPPPIPSAFVQDNGTVGSSGSGDGTPASAAGPGSAKAGR